MFHFQDGSKFPQRESMSSRQTRNHGEPRNYVTIWTRRHALLNTTSLATHTQHTRAMRGRFDKIATWRCGRGRAPLKRRQVAVLNARSTVRKLGMVRKVPTLDLLFLDLFGAGTAFSDKEDCFLFFILVVSVFCCSRSACLTFLGLIQSFPFSFVGGVLHYFPWFGSVVSDFSWS